MAVLDGGFIWYELMTPDVDGARAFYTRVVDWDIEEHSTMPNGYRMVATENGPIAGLFPLTPEMQAEGGEPAWVGYISARDVDAAMVALTADGATILIPPTDIPGIGRFAYVMDPAGAAFYIMKPTPSPDNPDAVSLSFSYDKPRLGHCAWNELATPDPVAALDFYHRHFGWSKDGEMPVGPAGTYHFVRHGNRTEHGFPPGQSMIGAIMDATPGLPSATWTHYFRVADIDDAVASINTLGGSVIVAPMEIPGGDFSMVARDPQGAVFALVGGRRNENA